MHRGGSAAFMKRSYELTNWTFRIGDLDPAVEKEVTLPHTWNTDPDPRLQTYRGVGSYEITLPLAMIRNRSAILYIGAAYHTANIYVNGRPAAYHTGCGYLPFEADITEYLQKGDNRIRIDVDNTPKKEMLPHMLDFDWADDGGLTRSVTLDLYEEMDFFGADIRYEVDVIRGDRASGRLFVTPDAEPQEYRVTVLDYKTGETVLSGVPDEEGYTELEFEDLSLWSPAQPNLYLVRILGETDIYEKRIGFRTIEVRGTEVLLNGKPIYLKGCEWMPGSHPEYGTAETPEISTVYLQKLREAGCNFTRFHWQQDDYIYDWCDEHGLMVQEEIPYWGFPKVSTPLQQEIAEDQAVNMVHYHGHHPSIAAWGVGNELNGAAPETIWYVDHMTAFFKDLDESRLVNYVSNTLGLDENVDEDDAALHGDIAMWNEYLGLWQPCGDVPGTIRRTAEKAGSMPFLVSEFGLCEPVFSGGDERRCEILRERLPLYHEIPNMCGYVYFCLNDYRTQVGEEGEGRLRRRVHGSTDLYGTGKPSYLLFRELQEKM